MTARTWLEPTVAIGNISVENCARFHVASHLLGQGGTNAGGSCFLSVDSWVKIAGECAWLHAGRSPKLIAFACSQELDGRLTTAEVGIQQASGAAQSED